MPNVAELQAKQKSLEAQRQAADGVTEEQPLQGKTGGYSKDVIVTNTEQEQTEQAPVVTEKVPPVVADTTYEKPSLASLSDSADTMKATPKTVAFSASKNGQQQQSASGYVRPKLSDMQDTAAEAPAAPAQEAIKGADIVEVEKPNLPETAKTQGKKSAKPSTTKRRNPNKIAAAQSPSDPKDSKKRAKEELTSVKTKGLYDKIEKPLDQTLGRKRGSRATKWHMKKIKSEVDNRSTIPNGNNLSGQLVAIPDTKIGLMDVSIGSNWLLMALQQPGNKIVYRLNKVIEAYNRNAETPLRTFTEDEFTYEEIATESITEFKQALDTVALWATVTKNPTSDPQSFQARILRCHYGDGIRLHPLAVKAFNADFDGDNATVHLDGKYVDQARNPIEYLIGVGGDCLIDWDYFAPINIKVGESVKTFKKWLVKLDVKEEYVDLAAQNFETLLSERNNDKKKQEQAALLFLHYLNEGCDRSARKVATCIESLYERVDSSFKIQMDTIMDNPENQQAIEDVNDFAELAELTDTERAQWKLAAQATTGTLGANWGEFLVSHALELEDDPKGAVQFRQTASIMKSIKRNPSLFVGEDGMYKSAAMTTIGLMAEAASAKTFDTTKLKKSERKRNFIIHDPKYGCGLPNDPKYNGEPAEFFKAFANAWNEYISRADLASKSLDVNLSVIEGTDMKQINITLSKDGKLLTKNNEFVKPFLDVYGDYSFGTIIGDKLINGIHFAGESTLKKKTRNGEQFDSLPYDSSLYIKNKGKKNETPELYVAHIYKHKTIREFAYKNHFNFSTNRKHKSRDNIVGNGVDGWVDFILSLADSRTSAAADYEKVSVQAFASMKNILERYRSVRNSLDDTSMQNVHVLSRKYVDVLAGTHPDMFAYYNMDNPVGFEKSYYGQAMLRGYDLDSIRMAMVYDWRTMRIAKLSQQIAECESEEQQAVLEQYLANEQAVLKSSSDTWEILASLTDEQFRAFCHRIKGGAKTLRRMSLSMEPLATSCTPEMIGNWETLDDFMLDVTVPGKTKRLIIKDLVIDHGGWIKMHENSVLYELELDPASNYAGTNIVGWEEASGIGLKSAMDVLSPYKNKKGEINEHPFVFKNEDGEPDFDEFEKALNNIRMFPRRLQAVSEDIWADATASTAFPTYSESEKSQQQEQQEHLYTALANNKIGGFIQEIESGDDFVMEQVGYDRLTKRDLINVLVFDQVLQTYDDYGNPCILSRSALGIESDADLFTVLQEYPQLCNLFVATSAYIDKKGRVKYAANTEKRWTRQEEAFQIMTDHPGFNGMCHLLFKHDNIGRGGMKTNIIKAKDQLIETLAAIDLDNPALPDLKLPDRTKSKLNELVLKYAAEVQEVYKRGSSEADWSWAEVDDASVAVFWKCVDTHNGAKTSISTGNEGVMTKQFSLIQLLMPFSPDCYLKVDANTDEEVRQRLVGSPTSEGVSYDGQSEAIVYAPNEEFTDPLLRIMRKGKDTSPMITSSSNFFILKRKDSSEKNNLKIKKTSDDGTDSISKRGRFDLNESSFESWMFNEDPNNPGVATIWWNMLNQGVDPELAIEKVRSMYAKRMMAANEKLGYKSMQLEHYMNLARWIVVPQIETDEETGEEYPSFCIRSLRQISSRLNTTVAATLPDLSEVKNNKDAAEVMNDVLDLMVTEADATGMTGEADAWGIVLSVPCFVSMREQTKYGAKDKRVSSFERNYNLIQRLAEQNGELEIMTPKQLSSLSTRLKDEYKKKNTSDVGIGFGYKMVGYVTADSYEVHKVPGITNVVLIGSDASPESIDRAFKEAFEAGTSLLFEDDNVLGVWMKRYPDFAGYVVEQMGNSVYNGVPCFDMILNGFGTCTSASWNGDPSNLTLVCEDAHGRNPYADAGAFGTESFGDKVHFNSAGTRKAGTAWTDNVQTMFMDTLDSSDGHGSDHSMWRAKYEVCTVEDIEHIAYGDPDTINIDFRVNEANNLASAVIKKNTKLINAFLDKWSKNPDQAFLEEGRPGECIGFAKVTLTDPYNSAIKEVYYAPIIPFPEYKHTSRDVPIKYKVTDLAFDDANSSISMEWSNTASMKDRFFKFFEGFCAANKTMMFTRWIKDHALSDGTNVDVFVAEATTSGRRLGSNRRRDTMLTMMGMTFKNDRWRYNIAEHEGFLPLDAELKKELLAGRVDPKRFDSVTQFHTDPDLDAWMKQVVKRLRKINVNPSDFFANKYEVDGVQKRANNFFEWEMMMEMSIEWQDGFLRFFNTMMPQFCPENTDDGSMNHLFRCCQDAGKNNLVMQMQVEWKEGNKPGYTWENIYASWGFFSEDNSMTTRPGLSAAQMEFLSLQMMLHGGQGTPMDFVTALRYAVSGTAPDSVRHKLLRKFEMVDAPDESFGASDQKTERTTKAEPRHRVTEATDLGFEFGQVDKMVKDWINGEDGEAIFLRPSQDLDAFLANGAYTLKPWVNYEYRTRVYVARRLNEARDEVNKKKSRRRFTPEDDFVCKVRNAVFSKLGLNEQVGQAAQERVLTAYKGSSSVV
ncbi:MAG: hypothetical protein KBT28_01650 [Bacteroidales bacterium]|nr:hypothetical protein [Candidatus Colimorpha merdihippi]